MIISFKKYHLDIDHASSLDRSLHNLEIISCFSQNQWQLVSSSKFEFCLKKGEVWYDAESRFWNSIKTKKAEKLKKFQNLGLLRERLFSLNRKNYGNADDQISCWELILQETNFCWELPFWFNVSRNIYFRDAWVSFWSWFGFGSGGSFFNTKALKRKQGYKHLENFTPKSYFRQRATRGANLQNKLNGFFSQTRKDISIEKSRISVC